MYPYLNFPKLYVSVGGGGGGRGPLLSWFGGRRHGGVWWEGFRRPGEQEVTVYFSCFLSEAPLVNIASYGSFAFSCAHAHTERNLPPISGIVRT